MMAGPERVIRGPYIVKIVRWVEDQHGFQKLEKLPSSQQLMGKITPDGP